MQIPPTSSLLHALSRLGETQPGVGRPQPPRADAPDGAPRPITPPDAARAAAKAAFQSLKSPPATAAPAPNAAPAETAPAPPAQPARPLPRGSFVNLVV